MWDPDSIRGLRSVINTVVPPAAKNSHSRHNSQSFLCVSVSHDHVHLWAHKLKMQHLQKENLFRFQSRMLSAP